MSTIKCLPRLRFEHIPETGRQIDLSGIIWDVQLVSIPTIAARPWLSKEDPREYLLIVCTTATRPQQSLPAPVERRGAGDIEAFARGD
jgi:hypothetical protein